MYVQCKYANSLKCKECKYSFHRECKLFVIARAKEISLELQPFQYSSKNKLRESVVWSRDVNKAKSAALRYGMKRNSRIKKYSLSQVISLALANEFIDESVVYIEYTNKLAGDIDKLKGVLTSFVETLSMRGTCISIYVAPSISFNLDYHKV